MPSSRRFSRGNWSYHFVLSTVRWRAASACAAAKSTGERMALLHQRLQALAQHVGVDLGGRRIVKHNKLMSTEQVGTVIPKRTGDGVVLEQAASRGRVRKASQEYGYAGASTV